MARTRDLELEEALESVGSFHKFQFLMFALLFPAAMFHGARLTSSAFFLYEPRHRCVIPGWPNDTYDIVSETHHGVYNRTIPPAESCHIYSRNHSFDYDADNRPINGSLFLEACPNGWVYAKSTICLNAVSQINLVCNNRMYKSHASMLLYLGSFVGSSVLGFVSDSSMVPMTVTWGAVGGAVDVAHGQWTNIGTKIFTGSQVFGRKVCFLLSVILFLASGLALPWSNNFATLGAMEFVVGAASTGMFASAFVMCLELVQAKDRKVPGLVIQMFFTTGEILLAVSCHSLRDWRWSGLVITAPATFFLFYIWIVPESLRWLMLKKKYDKASKILIRIAKMNGVTPPRGKDQEDILAELLQSYDDGVEQSTSVTHINTDSFFDLFKSRVLCQRACAIFFNWFVVNMVFYVFVLNMEHLKGGSLYVNFIISAVVEYPAHLFSLLLVDRVGRKPVHLFLLFVAGTASGAAVGVSMKVGEDHQWVVSMLSMIGKFGAAGLMGTSFLWLTELFPTSIRCSGLGVSSSFARGGAMVAPYIVLWGSMITDHKIDGALPFIVVCAASVLAFLFNLSLPETNRKELPATIADAKVFGKRRESLYTAENQAAGFDYGSTRELGEDSDALVFPPRSVLKGRTRQGSRSRSRDRVSLAAATIPIF